MEVPCSVTSDYNQKKRKLSNLNENISQTQKNAFENMRVVKILREDVRNKLVTILGRFADAEEDAVLLLEKKPFDKNSIAETLTASDSTTVETLKNDIYSTHDVFFSRTLPGTEMMTFSDCVCVSFVIALTIIIYSLILQHFISRQSLEKQHF